MYFSNYKEHPDATLNPALLWDFDKGKIDFGKMKNVIVQRVVERGWPQDWYFILNQYGVEGVRDAIRKNIHPEILPW